MSIPIHAQTNVIPQRDQEAGHCLNLVVTKYTVAEGHLCL